MKKIIFFILFFVVSFNSYSITEEELKEYKYIDFYNFISSYNVSNNYDTTNRHYVRDTFASKQVGITNNEYTTYLNPVKKYVTYLEYRGGAKKIGSYQKPFLLNWFKIVNSRIEFDEEKAETILADENFDLFYTYTIYSTKRKNYFIITQKAVNDLMAKQLKIGNKIKVYIQNLGQYQKNTPVFVIIGFEKSYGIEKEIEDKISFQEFLPTLKNNILNSNYDTVKGKIELLLKKYPNNVDLKLNLCLLYEKTGYFDKENSCYNEIIKASPTNYDAYYGLALSYYDNNRIDTKTKATEIIKNTTRSIELIEILLLDHKVHFL